jgi:hypothetical protein
MGLPFGDKVDNKKKESGLGAPGDFVPLHTRVSKITGVYAKEKVMEMCSSRGFY